MSVTNVCNVCNQTLNGTTIVWATIESQIQDILPRIFKGLKSINTNTRKSWMEIPHFTSAITKNNNARALTCERQRCVIDL